MSKTPMKKINLAISGTRTFDDYEFLKKKLDRYVDGLKIAYIVLGAGRHKISDRHVGVDYFAEQWANHRNFNLILCHADWARYEKAAGPLRNREMIRHADELVAIWDGKSPGTKDCITAAKRKGIPVTVIKY